MRWCLSLIRWSSCWNRWKNLKKWWKSAPAWKTMVTSYREGGRAYYRGLHQLWQDQRSQMAKAGHVLWGGQMSRWKHRGASQVQQVGSVHRHEHDSCWLWWSSPELGSGFRVCKADLQDGLGVHQRSGPRGKHQKLLRSGVLSIFVRSRKRCGLCIFRTTHFCYNCILCQFISILHQ